MLLILILLVEISFWQVLSYQRLGWENEGLSTKNVQFNLIKSTLIEQLNPKHPLFLLSKAIPWDNLEKKLSSYYPSNGRRAKPIRLMVGLLILKYLDNLSDERLIHKWVENPYYQYFCGYHDFQWKFPCHPTDLIYFRNRIGEDGCREILKSSIKVLQTLVWVSASLQPLGRDPAHHRKSRSL